MRVIPSNSQYKENIVCILSNRMKEIPFSGFCVKEQFYVRTTKLQYEEHSGEVHPSEAVLLIRRNKLNRGGLFFFYVKNTQENEKWV